MSEIRVRVTRDDINRAYEAIERDVEPERGCPVAQALIRLGYLNVEVRASNQVFIGMERFAAIDERPTGELLWRFIDEFDDSADDSDELERYPEPEPEEFVLRRVNA